MESSDGEGAGSDGYTISTNNEMLDIPFIHQFISQTYWAKGIPKSVLEKAIQHSLCFGVYALDGKRVDKQIDKQISKQVGFARLITDRASFAYLADVFIIDEHRGLGLSKWLIDAVVNHEDVKGMRRMMLATRDAHGLYAQFGFLPIENPEILMQIWRPNIYMKSQNDD
ncbi:GNAT family N-acetyltransferase [Shewanella donghaensis]|uniref:GNAT family N-acetyltransferase n=1 Tax=Shewanella donghaensis TaxID=238836 RepID=UPI001182AE48|nr:GNAT family N-acetyltransferase [Shewanella donghaensis]